MLIVGFTGSQRGMTELQIERVRQLLWLCKAGAPGPHWFVHGDCVGADIEAAILATGLGYKLWVFPSNLAHKRAFSVWDRIEPEGKPLARNHAMLQVCERLIAAPKQMFEVMRSGTWSTIRAANKLDKPVDIVYPR